MKILLIEDDEDDYILVRNMLASITSSGYHLDWVMTYADGMAEMHRSRHDVYLLDYGLGAYTGLELLREATAMGCRVPIILLTGQGDYHVDIEVMKAGAADYLMKDDISAPLLERSIRYSIQRTRTEEELRRHREHLEDLVESRTLELMQANEQLHREIAERKRAEEALRESQRLLRKTFASLDEAVYVVDLPARTIITCNSAMERVFGYSRKELIGQSDEMLHISPTKFEEFHTRVYPALNTSGVYHIEFQMKRKEGAVFFSDHSVTELRDDSGRLTGVVNVVRDITEGKKLAEDLLRIKKLEAAGTLAGGIAHDFNNLLSIIWGNLNMAQEEVAFDSNVCRLLDDVEEAVIRARDLIRQFITFATGGTPYKRLVTIDELLSNCIPLALNGSDVECRYSFPDSLWHIRVDQDQMNQVFYNMIINAKEAMPSGGIIRISAENVDLRSSREKADLTPLEGQYVRISIKDEGCGIRKEHLDRIFDPYFSTKTRGTQKGMGLGLAIALSVVKKHGGFIRLESEPGLGTAFHIHLPAATAKLVDDGESPARV